MRNRKNIQPCLESLESKMVLSTLTLGGTEHGVFLAHKTSAQTSYSLDAAGSLTPIGAAAITGTLKVDAISSGPPSGTLHLYSAKGTLTLQIPESVAIPAGLPTPTSKNEIVDTYVITGGTGAYKGDTGSGVVEITFAPVNSGSYEVGRETITFSALPTSVVS